MSATFKCLLSGQTVTFIHQVDIDSMKDHPDYVRVEETVVSEEETTVQTDVIKKPGRPKKVETAPEVE
jgi:hypothetical protein